MKGMNDCDCFSQTSLINRAPVPPSFPCTCLLFILRIGIHVIKELIADFTIYDLRFEERKRKKERERERLHSETGFLGSWLSLALALLRSLSHSGGDRVLFVLGKQRVRDRGLSIRLTPTSPLHTYLDTIVTTITHQIINLLSSPS